MAMLSKVEGKRAGPVAVCVEHGLDGLTSRKRLSFGIEMPFWDKRVGDSKCAVSSGPVLRIFLCLISSAYRSVAP